MISSSEFKKGIIIQFEGGIWRIVEYQPFRYAQRAAMVKIKLKDVRQGHTIERTIGSGDKFPVVQLDRRTAQYQYSDGQQYTFMDTTTYDQFTIDAEVLGDNVKYLAENMTLELGFYEGEPLDIQLPITVDLKVVDTAPGFKGDTAQGGGKPAKLETGLVVQVPFFINVGDTVRVDTRTNLVVTRVT
ncbi:MAG: elongation factor P [Chloroflexi bacterium]|nr:elongation factor P [Chloroflexota bacterium]